MNVYFACSITGGRQDEAIYLHIVEALQADGHDVPTALIAGPEVAQLEGAHPADEVYARDIAWLTGCDALVAEVSTPSHGVGYEVAYALTLGKPVLCLYRDGVTVSKMLTGNSRPTLRIRAYSDEGEALRLTREFLAGVGPLLDC